ncbi:MAG: F0F1 ATP synthase subunit B' [Alphaproteobacteria bacterium]|nr:F0F1 ATP synthase subunit B' [Alphaproteobacteria bacterium]MBF0250674.1 F0F1 ATP synthase subunit B' [Alphaproteobacteria bacterium]
MRILLKTVPMLGLSLVATPAFAAGLPQLDIAKFPPQLVWLVITFTALYVLMSRVALPRIANVLEERQNKIDDNLSRAEDLKRSAKVAAEAYVKAISDARAKAHASIRQVKEKADADARTRQDDLNAKLKADIASSEKAIATARDEALAGIKDVSTDVAGSVIERLIGHKAKDDVVLDAIEAVLKDRA